MTTIIDSNVLNRSAYGASDTMKDVLSDYGSPISEFEDAVTTLGFVSFGGSASLLSKLLSPQVWVTIGNHKQILPAEKALKQFGRLANTPNAQTLLYDESQMIFTSEAVGLANGMVWIRIIYTIFTVSVVSAARSQLAITALHLES